MPYDLQVLKNPSVSFQEGKSVDLGSLTSRGVKPYGPPVDVWAAGVLAYELVCGRCVGLLLCRVFRASRIVMF